MSSVTGSPTCSCVPVSLVFCNLGWFRTLAPSGAGYHCRLGIHTLWRGPAVVLSILDSFRAQSSLTYSWKLWSPQTMYCASFWALDFLILRIYHVFIGVYPCMDVCACGVHGLILNVLISGSPPFFKQYLRQGQLRSSRFCPCSYFHSWVNSPAPTFIFSRALGFICRHVLFFHQANILGESQKLVLSACSMCKVLF